jgi:uncharacterized membrane protein (DUF4010 family)
VVLGIATTAILAGRERLHAAVGALARDDVEAGLKLLFATFIVLPLLPDSPLDPWGAIVPYTVWALAVLTSTLSLAGYAATRWLGATRGLLVTAALAGLVSSTALTLAYARRSRVEPALAGPLAVGILVAWGVMSARVLVEVAIVNPAMLVDVVLPMAGMMVTGGGAALILHLSAGSSTAPGGEVELRNPFSLTEATKFTAMFAAVLLGVAIADAYLPDTWLYGVAALAGASDVDAVTLSMASLGQDPAQRQLAAGGVLVGVASNTVTKASVVVAMADPALRVRVGIATAALVIAALFGLFVTPLLVS